MRITSPGIILMVVAASAGGAWGQIPEGYEVVVLANDLGIHSRPEINNRSEVVWSSAFPPDVADVWLYSDGVIRKISDDGGYDIHPTMNDEGLVPWLRCESYFDTECVLAVYEDGQVSTVPTPFSVNPTVCVNNTGMMVWEHDFSGTADHVELFVTDGDTTQITNNGLSNQSARVNLNGDIVWIEYNFWVPPWRSKVMLWRAGEGLPIELTDGTGNPQGTGLNDSTQVVFRQYDGSEHMIRMWENGVVTTISPGTMPRISNRGDITFGRWDESTQIRYQVLFTDGTFYQLPSTIGWWSAKGDLNDLGELAWREIDPIIGDTRIMMLRKVGAVGDFNRDCSVDSFDFAQFQRCFTGANSGPPGGLLGDCTRGDFDEDGDIDVDDYGAFLDAQTGPAVDVPGCAP